MNDILHNPLAQELEIDRVSRAYTERLIVSDRFLSIEVPFPETSLGFKDLDQGREFRLVPV